MHLLKLWWTRYRALRGYAFYLKLPTYWWEGNDSLAMRIGDHIRELPVKSGRRELLNFRGGK